jgi:hypothetical protein
MSTFTTLQNISQYSRFIYPQILQDSIRTQENEGQRCIVRWMLHIALINSLYATEVCGIIKGVMLSSVLGK